MRRVAVKIAKREAKAAEAVLKARPLPKGVRGFTIEPGEDEGGDLVMWVWIDVEEPNRRDSALVERLVSFMSEVRDALFNKLEEYRPHVGVR